MKNQKLNDFKEILKQIMIENFQRDGHLTPLLFLYKNDEPVIHQIPEELLSSKSKKELLANMIRTLCQEPTVLAAGIMIEAKKKQDIILMVFSTPEGEEIFTYPINRENRIIGEPLDAETKKNDSIFFGFFSGNKN